MSLTITPGQAMILWMEHHKDSPEMRAVKKLYLMGVISEQDRDLYNSIKADPCIRNFDISENPADIDKDPTRRYFETILSYHTVKNHITGMPEGVLRDEFSNLVIHYYLAKNPHCSRAEAATLATPENYISSFMSSSSALNHALKGNQLYMALGKEDLFKYQSLFCISHLVLQLSNMHVWTELGRLYKEGFFHQMSRGRTKRKDFESSISRGILRAGMPTPYDESCDYREMRPNNKGTYAVTTSLSRGPELTRPDYTKPWPEKAFKTLVHPFVNSISGTILLQLRWLVTINKTSSLWNDVILNDFLRLFIAARLYSSGGHSLYEFVSVLEIREIRQAFASLEGFERIDMNSLFLEGNEAAFDTALSRTIKYTNNFLGRRSVHEELTDRFFHTPQKKAPEDYAIFDGFEDSLSADDSVDPSSQDDETAYPRVK